MSELLPSTCAQQQLSLVVWMGIKPHSITCASLGAFQRTAFCLIICYKAACASCSACSHVKRGRRASSLLEERQLGRSDANSNESSVTPMFSGLAFFQCKV